MFYLSGLKIFVLVFYIIFENILNLGNFVNLSFLIFLVVDNLIMSWGEVLFM